MLERLILYRNELKNKSIYSYKLIGILIELIYSREIFPQNSNIGDFLLDVFNIQYKKYVMRSRTIIVSRICRFIMTRNEDRSYNRKILDFINARIAELSLRRRSKDVLRGWVK